MTQDLRSLVAERKVFALALFPYIKAVAFIKEEGFYLRAYFMDAFGRHKIKPENIPKFCFGTKLKRRKYPDKISGIRLRKAPPKDGGNKTGGHMRNKILVSVVQWVVIFSFAALCYAGPAFAQNKKASASKQLYP